MDPNNKITNSRGQICPCQCKSQVPWIQAGFPIQTWDISGSPVLYTFCTCLVAQSLLKNFLATLQGEWLFTLWGWVGDKTAQRAVGVLDWVYSSSCFGVCDSLGSCLLRQKPAQGMLCVSCSDPPWKLALGKGGESPTAKFLGDWAMEKWRNVCQWLGLGLFWAGVETRDE